jgi:hypothetical protein
VFPFNISSRDLFIRSSIYACWSTAGRRSPRVATLISFDLSIGVSKGFKPLQTSFRNVNNRFPLPSTLRTTTG